MGSIEGGDSEGLSAISPWDGTRETRADTAWIVRKPEVVIAEANCGDERCVAVKTAESKISRRTLRRDASVDVIVNRPAGFLLESVGILSRVGVCDLVESGAPER